MSIIDDLSAAASHDLPPADRAQLRLAADEYALLDGTVLDLRHDFADCAGVVWTYTGRRTRKGEPLMRSRQDPKQLHEAKPVPLSDVYRCHGPLIPLPIRTTKADCLAAIRASSGSVA